MTILPKKKAAKESRGSQQGSAGGASAANSAESTGHHGRHATGAGRAGADSPSTSRARPDGQTNRKRASTRPPTRSTTTPPDAESPNSDDEYGAPSSRLRSLANTPAELQQLEERFEQHLFKAKGFKLKKMKTDGACLFRGVADQIYGDEEMHGNVRKLCMDYMMKNVDHYSQYITEDFNQYVTRKRVETAHGNNVEMQAMAEMFCRPIEVYEYSAEPMNTFQPESGKENPPIRLSYHGGAHYNSLVDPNKATIGVGLGLPNLYPGLADHNLMGDAMRQSENEAIEEAMLLDKQRATDWEATDLRMAEQVARESYLDWLRTHEQQRAADKNAPCHSRAPQQHSPKASTSSGSAPSPKGSTCKDAIGEAAGNATTPVANETVSIMNQMSSGAFGLQDWASDDSDLLRRVLAQSEKEYFETLKKQS